MLQTQIHIDYNLATQIHVNYCTNTSQFICNAFVVACTLETKLLDNTFWKIICWNKNVANHPC